MGTIDQSNERTTLLPSGSAGIAVIENGANNLNEDTIHNYGSALRRRSSAAIPPYHEDFPEPEETSSTLAIWTVIPVSLLGVLVANADGSLVVASSQQIASEFDALVNASWLVTSFGLAQCATQPLYGKLSDIFGRKSNLITSYTLFAAGCLLCGIGSTYEQVIAGRAISGMGGAGMTALVSIIIADMVPVRQVAAWRSYVNVAATTGRALGGPLGGWLCDTIGWRWCFYGQVPFTVLGMLLILWRMPTKPPKYTLVEEQTFRQKLKRVDVVGALLLASTIATFLLALDFSSKELPPIYTIAPAIFFVILATAFAVVEKKWAKEPVLPLELIVKRPALTSYLLSGFQIAAQYGTFYSTPLYFQMTSNVSVANAGSRLVPAVIGNATAGLLSGFVVSKTGRYKPMTISASIMAIIGYTLITIRWRGSTSWWETLYITGGGFGSGTMQSTPFIHLAANLDPSQMAIAGTTLYMSQSIFLLVGIQIATTLLHATLRSSLDRNLDGFKNKAEIIRSAISSVESVRTLPTAVRDIVVDAYIDSFTYTFGLSIVFAALGLVVGLTIQEKRL